MGPVARPVAEAVPAMRLAGLVVVEAAATFGTVCGPVEPPSVVTGAAFGWGRTWLTRVRRAGPAPGLGRSRRVGVSAGARTSRAFDDRFDDLGLGGPNMAGPRRRAPSRRPSAAIRGGPARARRRSLWPVGPARALGAPAAWRGDDLVVLITGLAGEQRRELGRRRRERRRHRGGDRGFRCLGVLAGGWRSATVRHPDVPAAQADEQHDRRCEEHQGEALDQRIAAIDRQVLDPGELTAGEQEVGAGNADEQEQRRLDDRREHRLLPDREHCGEAAEDIARGEHRAEFSAA